MPVAIAHGEGQAKWLNADHFCQHKLRNQLRFVMLIIMAIQTQEYPANPNGSPLGAGWGDK